MSYDVPLRPTLLLHLGAGYQSLVFGDTQYRSYSDPVTNKTEEVVKFDSINSLGLKGAAAPGFPRFTGLVTSFGGMQNMGAISNSIQILQKPSAVASITSVQGNHTYKLGADWRIDAFTPRSLTGS